MKKNWFLKPAIFLPVFFILILIACSSKNTEWKISVPYRKENMKIAFLLCDKRDKQAAYGYPHYEGLMSAIKDLNLDQNQLAVYENVKNASEEEALAVARKAIKDGAMMIIAANPLYEAVCKKLSAEFHYVIFAVSGGSSFNDTNLTSYAGRIYEALYLCGIAAGLKTVNEKIGFVSAKHFYKDEVYSDADAFAMGVESVNPHARVYVQITGDGADAAAESANYLFSLGCDVVGQDCDTPSPQIAAQNAGRFGTGFNRDMIADAPDAVLTCAIWHWEDFYKKLLQSVIDGTFTTTPYYGGLAEGIVDITPLSKNVQRGTEEIINSEKRRIKDKSFRIFEGFLLTNDGNVTGSIADALNDDEIRAIDWYYHNIVQTDY